MINCPTCDMPMRMKFKGLIARGECPACFALLEMEVRYLQHSPLTEKELEEKRCQHRG